MDLGCKLETSFVGVYVVLPLLLLCGSLGVVPDVLLVSLPQVGGWRMVLPTNVPPFPKLMHEVFNRLRSFLSFPLFCPVCATIANSGL